MFNCIMNVTDKTVRIEGEGHAKQCLINFIFEGETIEDKLDLRNVSFGYQFQKSQDEIIEESWPIKGMRLAFHSPGQMTSALIPTSVNTDYKFLVWFSVGESRNTETVSYNSGMPPKEYDSMVWNEELEDWEMLKPYPEITTDEPIRYFWNEETLEWEEDVEYRKFFSKLEPVENGEEIPLEPGVDVFLYDN